MQNLDQAEYQLDTTLTGKLSDRAFLIKDYESKVTEIEESIRKYRSDMVRWKRYQRGCICKVFHRKIFIENLNQRLITMNCKYAYVY